MKTYMYRQLVSTLFLAASIRSLEGMQLSMHVLARKNNIEELSKNLLKGVNVDATDENGDTPLHIAASLGHKKVIALLCAFKANVHLRNNEGHTAHDMSQENGHTAVGKMLQALTADNQNYGEKPQETAKSKSKPGPQKKVPPAKNDTSSSVNDKDAEGKTALHRAAEKGDQELVKQLLDQEADVNAQNNKGGTPLHAAAYNGHASICEMLIDDGSEIQRVNKFGNSALHVAALQGHTKVCSVLLDAGTDVTITNENGHTAAQAAQRNKQEALAKLILNHKLNVARHKEFAQAIDTDNLDEVRRLLDQGVDCNGKNEEGNPFLLLASKKYRYTYARDCGITELLLARGADVHITNKEGYTPLHFASTVDRAALLLDHGADIHAESTYGYTPLSNTDEEEIAQFLLQKGAGANHRNKDLETPLHQCRDVEVAKVLLNHGADVKAKNSSGRIPLHSAVTKSYELVKLLLKKGSPINSADEKGKTPLYEAIARYSSNVYEKYPLCILELLVRQGADLNAVDQEGRTPFAFAEKTIRKKIQELEHVPTCQEDLVRDFPHILRLLKGKKYSTSLHLACRTGDTDYVKILLDRKMSVHTVDENGKTPLQVAEERNDQEIVALLLEHELAQAIEDNDLSEVRRLLDQGADCNGRNKEGSTFLYLASMEQHLHDSGIAELLLERGADVHAADEKGYTPLHSASTEEIAALLVAHGADIHAETKNGFAPIFFARSAKVAQFLLQKAANANHRNRSLFTPLHQCRDVEVAKVLLNHGADVKAKDSSGRIPLHDAVTKSYELVKLLLKKGSPINSADEKGKTPLHVALSSYSDNDYERYPLCILELLIAQGADLKAVDQKGRTPFALAEKKIRKEIASNKEGALKRDFPHILRLLKGKKYSTSLHLACKSAGELDEFDVETFLNRKMSVHTLDENGKTPLQIAQERNNQAIIKLLLEHEALTRVESKGTSKTAGANKEKNAPSRQTHDESKPPVSEATKDTPKAFSAENAKRRKLFAKAIDDDKPAEVARLLDEGADSNGKTEAGIPYLIYACKKGRTEIIKLLMTHGANVRAADDDGDTPLHCIEDNKALAELLIQKGAEVNARNKILKTPLHACYKKEVTKVLLAHGADVNAQDKYGVAPLHNACSENCTEIARMLLALGAKARIADSKGETPLHVVRNGEIAVLLLKNGAEVNERNNYFESPLHTCDENDVVKVLLANGADINAQDRFGRTPLHSPRTIEIIDMLCAKGAQINSVDKKGRTPLHSFIEEKSRHDSSNDQICLIERLLARGSNVNDIDCDGKTPLSLAEQKIKEKCKGKYFLENCVRLLKREKYYTSLHWACRSGNLEQVKKLVKGASSVKVVDQHGSTPLHAAAQGKEKEVIAFLIQQGADRCARDQGGETPLAIVRKLGDKECIVLLDPYPLHSAIEEGNVDDVKELLAKGSDPNVIDAQGNTCLNMAIKKGHTKIAVLLIEHKAFVSTADDFKKSPLHYAIESAYTALAKILLEKGAQVNAQDHKGNTALHKAIEISDAIKIDFIEHLIACGANLKATNEQKQTPLQLAKKCGARQEIIDLLKGSGKKTLFKKKK